MVEFETIYNEEVWVNTNNITHIRKVIADPSKTKKYEGDTTQIFLVSCECEKGSNKFVYVKGAASEVAEKINLYYEEG